MRLPGGLPGLLVLTDRTQCTGPVEYAVAAAVDAGARAVVVREKDLSVAERVRLAARVAAILEPVAGLLIVAGAAGQAQRFGVHLAAEEPFPHAFRPALVGRSCHDAASVARARAEGCDYVIVAPVFETASKPGYGPVLGIEGLASLTRLGAPAYALGGVFPTDVSDCLDAGACGVAVMGPVMRTPELVAGYLAALQRFGS